MSHNLKIISKLSEIDFKYAAYIIDIWGVLWDGIEPYEYSITTLKMLINSGKTIILLSNAPRRARLVSERLYNIGITGDLYHKIISSGEICRVKFLKNKERIKQYGNIYYFIGQPPDKTITEKLSLIETKNIKEAKFLLVCGTRNFEDKLEKYTEELDKALSLKLPLVCANPDKVVIRKTGELLICAGLMADYYSSKGGIVYSYGKPFRETYNLCLDYLKTKDLNFKIKDIICIGDSLETDISGANDYGIASLLIANGIHKNDLSYDQKLISKIKLKKFFKEKNTYPDYILQNFSF